MKNIFLMRRGAAGQSAGDPNTPQLLSVEIGTVNGSTIVLTFDRAITASDYAAGWTVGGNGDGIAFTKSGRGLPVQGVGTITQSGTTVVGIGTTFLTDVATGKRILNDFGIDGIVQSIASDTELELDTSATVAIGKPYLIVPSTNHAKVFAIIPIPYHGADDVITIAYNAGAGNIVSEADATPLATFGAQTVTNNIAWLSLLDLQADTGLSTDTTPFAGTGTITQLGNDISGVSTLFGAEIVVGDLISGDGISGIVTVVTDDTTLTLDSSATVAVGISFSITPQVGTARINTWADHSISGHDFSQSGTARPSKQLFSGYSAIFPDGYNDWMLGGNFADNLDDFTVVCVGDIASTSLNKITNNGCDENARGWIINYGICLYQNFDDYICQSFATVSGNAPWVISYEIISRSELHTYINGIIADSSPNGGEVGGNGVTNYSTSESVRLFVDGAMGGCAPFSGAVSLGYMICVPAPPSADRLALESRVGARYGVPDYI